MDHLYTVCFFFRPFPPGFSRRIYLGTTKVGGELGCYGIYRVYVGPFGVWCYLGQVQHSTSSTRTRSLPGSSPTPPPARLWPDSISPPLCQRRCTNTSALLAMDPQQSSSTSDIFSLSDQTLAERLQFIEEVYMTFSHSKPRAPLTYASPSCRLVMGTGEVYGDVALNLTLRPNHHPTSMRRSSSRLSSFIGPRPKLPLPESVRCM